MFAKVLIANRALVASRLIRTLRRLGAGTVAVHSEADRDLPFVAEADEAVCIGPAPAKASYLNVDALLDAAEKSGAAAIHPGYGFLSENADFARRVRARGLAFIGPEPDHVARMGDKVAARACMAGLGVPVLPGTEAVDGDDAGLARAAEAVGFPLLVKAAAGGGGIGMQRVPGAEALAAAVKKTREVSGRAFGAGAVYLERLLEAPRHVEFQIAGDGTGAVRAIYERDCSIQRRHQKVIEESPAPGLRDGGAAVAAMAERLARALGGLAYANLGTVEMLMDDAGALYFLEMNTRLQVEHAVTEAVTGLDLVEVQVRLARGEKLADVLPARIDRRGHAIEARVYAEDPIRFLPSPGTLSVFRPAATEGVRIDVATREGAAVTPYYDPLLALVVAHGEDRAQAIARLDQALAGFEIAGVKTNLPFLRRMLASESFRAARHHTGSAEALARETREAAA